MLNVMRDLDRRTQEITNPPTGSFMEIHEATTATQKPGHLRAIPQPKRRSQKCDRHLSSRIWRFKWVSKWNPSDNLTKDISPEKIIKPDSMPD